jgi:hypothetical protein
MKSGVLQNPTPFALNADRQVVLLLSLQVLLLPCNASDMKLGCPRIGMQEKVRGLQ